MDSTVHFVHVELCKNIHILKQDALKICTKIYTKIYFALLIILCYIFFPNMRLKIWSVIFVK